MVALIFSVIAIVLSTGSWVGYRLLWNKRDVAALIRTMTRVEQILDRMELATFVVAVDRTTNQAEVMGAVESTHDDVRATHDEVRTYNSLTMGQKSDADETRRIEAIPEADRTAQENRHVGETT